MKCFKKFLGVFLALAMVVGVIGMMPAVEAKADAAARRTELAKLTTSSVTGVEVAIGASTTDLTTEIISKAKLVQLSDPKFVVTAFTITAGETPDTSTAGSYSISGIFTMSETGVTPPTTDADEPVTINYKVIDPNSSSSTSTTIPSGKADDIIFNKDILTLTVKKTGASFIYVGAAKISSAGVVTAPKTYDVFKMEDGEIGLDLSVYGVKKDIELWIHFGDESEANISTFTIEKNIRKLSPKYFPGRTDDTKKFEFVAAADTTFNVNNLEYRVGAATDWKDYDLGDLLADAEFASRYGTTIYFRDKAIITYAEDKVTPIAYKFPSAEGKVKIAKQAAAPKVTVDYTTGKVKFPKGVYIINAKSAPAAVKADDWTALTAAATAAVTVDLADLFTNTSDDMFFQVRIPAASTAEKKPASKIASIFIKGQNSAPEFDDVLSYKVNLNRDNSIKGILLTNLTNSTTGDEIQYAIVAANVEEKDIPANAWKKIAKGKVDLAINDSSIEGKKLYYKVSGVKAKTGANPVEPVLVSKADSVIISLYSNIVFESATVTDTTGTTTAIVMTFDNAVTDLPVDKIVLGGTPGVAEKGALTSSSDKKTWTLAVTTKTAGDITVKVDDFGLYKITGTNPKTVTLIKATE